MGDNADLLPPISCADCALGSRTLYAPTIAQSPDAIYARRREVRTIPTARTIFREGEVPDLIFTLYSGWAIRYRQMDDGRRQILSFIVPGDLLVVEALLAPHLPLPFAVKSITPLALCAFAVSDMLSLMRVTEAQRQAFAQAQQRLLSGMADRMTALGRRSAVGRVAQLLLELERRLDRRRLVSSGRFDFPVRQEHLADALGLTTVYVNRTLVALRKAGVIALDRNTMTIRDPEELQRIAREE